MAGTSAKVRNSLRPLWVLWFIFICGAVAHGDIQPAKGTILDLRNHRFLTTLADQLGFDDTELPRGHAVASISISGCNFTVLVVGPVQADAKKYARAIDAWRAGEGFLGKVNWSQEDDGAAAAYRYTAGRFGLDHATTAINLQGLRNALITLEPNVQFAVTDAVWSNASIGAPPDKTARAGTRYWDLTRPRPELSKAVGTIAVPAWMPWVLATWFLLLPVGMCVSFAIGVVILKRESIPLPQRRKLYGRAVLGGTYGILGVHSLLVMATLPTRAFDPLTQLWFGQRFAQVALPIMPVFIFIPLVALPFIQKLEKRFLEPSEEEKQLLDSNLILRPVVASKAGLMQRVGVLPLIIAVVGVTVLPHNSKAHPEFGWIRIALLLGSLALFLVSLRLVKGPAYSVTSEELDLLGARLRDRVQVLATTMNMQVPLSRVFTEVIYGKLGAHIDRKGVGVTIHALDFLTDPELDFLVAHELAHQKLGHLKQRQTFVYGSMAVIIVPFLALMVGRSLAVVTPGYIFSPLLIPIVLGVPARFYLRNTMQKQELAADALAIQVTGDPTTAMATLRKITLNSDLPGIHDTDMSSHPTVATRLAAMSRM